ncbi:MAG: HD domain-containing protein, partial [Collinsella intestinalis]
AQALAECAPLLDQVARERVGIELEGILVTRHGGDALIRYPELMCAAIPELARMRGFDQCTPYHAFDVYDHTARVLTVAGELSRFRIDGGDPSAPPSPSLMWAALLHDIAKPDCFTVDERGRGHFYGHPEAGAKLAEKIMRRLSCSNDLIRNVSLLIHDHDRPLDPDRISLLRQMQRFARSGVDTARLMGELLDLKRADTLGKASGCFYYVEEIERMREMCRELLANREAYSIKTLDLAGSDLIARGMAPGPRIGEALNRALEGAIGGAVANEREALLAYLGF